MAIETSNKGSTYASYLNFFGKEPSRSITIADVNVIVSKLTAEVADPVRRLVAVRSDSSVASELSQATEAACLSIGAIVNPRPSLSRDSVFEVKQKQASQNDNTESLDSAKPKLV